jgi:hypothetical protein
MNGSDGSLWLAGHYPASPALLRRDRTAGLRRCTTLSPCSQLHARLARSIAGPAGGLLPHPFSPYPWTRKPNGGIALCCGCSHTAVTDCMPTLTVSCGNRFEPANADSNGSREVPLAMLCTTSDGFHPPRTMHVVNEQNRALSNSKIIPRNGCAVKKIGNSSGN